MQPSVPQSGSCVILPVQSHAAPLSRCILGVNAGRRIAQCKQVTATSVEVQRKFAPLRELGISF